MSDEILYICGTVGQFYIRKLYVIWQLLEVCLKVSKSAVWSLFENTYDLKEVINIVRPTFFYFKSSVVKCEIFIRCLSFSQSSF